ncbi:MAG: hypoxanthine-guanine phosphoribosyltransferase [Gammaproteobacteria bacterium]|nr:hypoxanthine-guanine phosphoribosyltransferase [Gammaproteobacteria bacterium]
MSVTLEQAQQVLDNADLIYSADDISIALDKLASDLSAAVAAQLFNDKPVIVISIMNGGLVLSGHLLTRLQFPLQVDFIHATRYRNQTSGGELEWKVEPHQSIKNRTLIILDDILDEGYTLDAIKQYCYDKGAANVISAVLVEKKHERRKADVDCDFVGLPVEDRYVFGFGMDYKGYHRNLNGIYAVSDD